MLNRLVGILLLTASLCAAQEIRTIVAEGVGSDPQNAAQDAAQNALTNVVGTFIDANKQLEKRSEIRDGIRSQTTKIRTDIREYSQGSIQSFEVVDVKKETSLYRLTAKVGVRIDDFRAYIKQLAEGETKVGGGLFAEMTTSQKQSDSLAQMLSERIRAVVNGEVVKFSVSRPVPFRRSRFANESRNIGPLVGRFNPNQLVVFDVTATLDGPFLTNLIQTLDSTATSKKRVAIPEAPLGFVKTYAQDTCWDRHSGERETGRAGLVAAQRVAAVRMPYLSGLQMRSSDRPSRSEPSDSFRTGDQDAHSSFCLSLIDGNLGTATIYRLSDIEDELVNYMPWLSTRSFVGESSMRGINFPNLEIAVLDNAKRELQVDLIEATGQRSERIELQSAIEWFPSWLLYVRDQGVNHSHGGLVLPQRTFSVVMKVEDEALRQADSIRVRLVK